METKQQNKLVMEPEVPKASSIDSSCGVENGHIWEELAVFSFLQPFISAPRFLRVLFLFFYFT